MPVYLTSKLPLITQRRLQSKGLRITQNIVSQLTEADLILLRLQKVDNAVVRSKFQEQLVALLLGGENIPSFISELPELEAGDIVIAWDSALGSHDLITTYRIIPDAEEQQ